MSISHEGTPQQSACDTREIRAGGTSHTHVLVPGHEINCGWLGNQIDSRLSASNPELGNLSVIKIQKSKIFNSSSVSSLLHLSFDHTLLLL